jgi:hypothetical protein
VGEEFADFRAVLGDEGGDVVEIFYVHRFSAPGFRLPVFIGGALEKT